MKEFDWNECKATRHPESVALLEQCHDKPLSESEFIRQMLALPHNELKTSETKFAKEYQHLKKTFGFFESVA